MKVKQRFLALMLAVTMLTACCVSCGDNKSSSENSGASESSSSEQASVSESSESESASESESESATKPVATKPGYEKDIPNLKDSIASKDGLGEDAIVGCVLNNGTISNRDILAMAKKHFNAVTFENETKVDAHLGYAGNKPALVDYELNGKTVQMPKLSFGADRMLNVLLAWNEEHPESKIRVRGHTLVWHSQTPEWFFHEDFDESKPYVTPEVMDVREEWFIKYVLEHYHGEDSKYKDMFYAWDVVNEAVSDGRSDYRNGDEGSSWWKVYQSNKFIINAFKFANKYAPADIDLYYNDYGDCSTGKMKGICKLLNDVKAEEGEPGVGTRITGMGMQAHYNSGSPSKKELENAVRTYAGIVDKVMLTEFDRACSNLYNGTDRTKESEYMKHGQQWQGFYEVLKALDKEEGINVAGITFWGVADNNSWIQETVNGRYTKCPLLFDVYYKAKPAFWAFVDPDRMGEMFGK